MSKGNKIIREQEARLKSLERKIKGSEERAKRYSAELQKISLCTTMEFELMKKFTEEYQSIKGELESE